MKTPRQLLTLLVFCLPFLTKAQVDVPQNKELKSATILAFRPPYKAMFIYLENEESNRHGVITMRDTTLFLKKAAFNKRPKYMKPTDMVEAADFRPGMKVNVQVDFYQISQRNEAKRVALDEGYYGPTSLVGIYEKLEGDRATIDGQVVVLQLEKGRFIEGLDEWKGKKFTSFNDMQLGAEVKVFGERKPDGLVYASRGTMRPTEMSKEDYLLRKATDNELKVTRDLLEIANTWKFQLVANNRLEAYVSTVGRRLIPDYLKSLPLDHADHVAFKFYVVDEGSFNARSYPNGAIVVHSGLLRQIDNEAQLAAILGHEIAHVTQKHHARNFRNHQNWEAVKVFGELVALGTRDITPMLVTATAAEMSVSGFSQKQETQADRIGLHYMVNAGYDPRQAVAIWKRLAEEDRDDRQKGQQTAALSWIQKSYRGTPAGTVEAVSQPDPSTTPAEQPLFPLHPSPRSRYTHVNFLLSTAYSQLNLDAMKKEDVKYAEMRSLLDKPVVSEEKPVVKTPKAKTGTKALVRPKKG